MLYKRTSPRWLTNYPNIGSFALLPMFFYGMEDGVNLCGSATLLVFFLLLSKNVLPLKKVVLFGIAFMNGIFFTKYLMVFGAFDIFLTDERSLLFNRIGYCILGIVFIVFGIRYFRSWKISSFSENQIIPADLIPNFFSPTQQNTLFRKREYLKIFVFFCVGVLMVLLESAMMHDYHLFWRVNHFVVRGENQTARANVLLYLAGALLPIFLLWGALIVAVKNSVAATGRKMAYYLMICSALFLSIGAGLVIQFIR